MITGDCYKVNVACDCHAAGGRGGSTYGQSKALNDVWRFTVASRSWTQLTTSGRAPLPRFLFGYDIMYPMLHRSSTYKQAPQSVTNANTHEQHPETSSNTSPHLSAASSELHTAPDKGAGMQPADTRPAANGQNDGAAGSMIVFGGESIKGCYLDDVWVLHLNSLMWQELSRPVACQKRCRSILEQN